MVYVWTGSTSAFEDFVQPPSPGPQPVQEVPSDNVAAKLIMEIIVPFPRLLLLIRKYRRSPSPALATRILQLAKNMHAPEQSHLIEEHILKSVRIVNTVGGYDPALVPKSYHFHTLRALMLLLFLNTQRVVISGIINRLFDLQLASEKDFDRARVNSEDLHAAETIAMCTQFALDPDFDPPLPALRLCGPANLAWGCWDRFEKRLLNDLSVNESFHTRRSLARAASMKKFCFETARRSVEIWQWEGLQEIFCQNSCEAFSGGDFFSPFKTTTRLMRAATKKRFEAGTILETDGSQSAADQLAEGIAMADMGFHADGTASC